MRWLLGVVAVLTAALLGVALINLSSDDGVTATWDPDPDESIAPTSDSFTALVTRLECSSGVTGTVLEPTIETKESEVVVTFLVEDLHLDAADCQGNPSVPYEVTLEEPLGDRVLRDGQCLPGAEAETTSACGRDGIRWPPASDSS